MNRNIIIAILVVIIIAAVGFFVFSQGQPTTDGKINTQISFLSQNTLKNGEQVQFELKDAQGNPIAGELVNITYKNADKGVDEKYAVYTDNAGKGYLTINGEDAGSYDVAVDYGGNDKYAACSAKVTITVEDGTSDETPSETNSNSSANTLQYNDQSSSDSSSSSSSGSSGSGQLYYDSELNVYYNANGIIVGGQDDGESYTYLKNNPPEVDEEGNLV
ncbi:Ig-like domain-containing protein [Methanobrevibacter sp.]|uniref:Ig-like domain-containing protein n=1 Tax=Methanobrevibacter sp. TaxID=66852 RepID=UPI0038699E83